jgi:hypothetical protein
MIEGINAVTSTQRYYIKANPSTNPENMGGTFLIVSETVVADAHPRRSL